MLTASVRPTNPTALCHRAIPATGIVTLLVDGRRCLQRVFPSSRSGHCSPWPHSFAAKLAKCLTADQVTLNVEGVVDGGVC